MALVDLPAEAVWRILLATNSPRLIYKVLPLVCRRFHQIIKARSVVLLVHADIMCEESEEDGLSSSLIQLPEAVLQIATNVVDAGFERNIRIHAGAITEHPERLLMYIEDLLRRCPKGRVLPFRVVYGRVQIHGRRGTNVSLEAIAGFVALLQAQNISLWCWDTELIRAIARLSRSPSIRLPNMKSDGHISTLDFSAVAGMKSLVRMELFRPFPRQPWGIDAGAFMSLTGLPSLKALVVSSGRLVQRPDSFKDAILSLHGLEILDLSWTVDYAYASRILRRLKKLCEFRYVHVGSSDFWISLPSYYVMGDTPLLPVTMPQQPTNPEAIHHLQVLGLHFSQPDAGDLAAMVEGIVRCLPNLKTLCLRILRPTDSEYDFFALPRDMVERQFRRLEARTTITMVVLEMGLRMWASRKSYADDLILAFSGTKMKLRLLSPMATSPSRV
eukprot:jgi/Hompol1/2503/HPOL_006028-RA